VVSFQLTYARNADVWRTCFIARADVLGETIQGRFLCQKSKTNSRELDVELHYESKSGAQERVVATYKVC